MLSNILFFIFYDAIEWAICFRRDWKNELNLSFCYKMQCNLSRK